MEEAFMLKTLFLSKARALLLVGLLALSAQSFALESRKTEWASPVAVEPPDREVVPAVDAGGVGPDVAEAGTTPAEQAQAAGKPRRRRAAAGTKRPAAQKKPRAAAAKPRAKKKEKDQGPA